MTAPFQQDRTIIGPPKTLAQGVLYFYDKSCRFYEFSNYYQRNSLFTEGEPNDYLIHSGRPPHTTPYISTEHYFQINKFRGDKDNFHKVQKRGMAVQYCGKTEHNMGPDWGNWIRRSGHGTYVDKWWDGGGGDLLPGCMRVMYNALKYKFFQNEDLNELLKSTGKAFIVEASPYDGKWGYSKTDRSGRPTGEINGSNLLGLLLMQIRDEINRFHPSHSNATCPYPLPRDRSYEANGYYNIHDSAG